MYIFLVIYTSSYLIIYFIFINLTTSIIKLDTKAKVAQIIKLSKPNTIGIANTSLINGKSVASNITKQIPTAPNAYLLLVNPNLNILSVFDLDGNVCNILDKVRVKNAIAQPNSGDFCIPIY